MNKFEQDKCVSVFKTLYSCTFALTLGFDKFTEQIQKDKTSSTKSRVSKRVKNNKKKTVANLYVYTCFRPNLFHCRLIQVAVVHHIDCIIFCVCSACKLNEDIERHILFNVNRIYGILIKNNKTYDRKQNKCTATKTHPNECKVRQSWLPFCVCVFWFCVCTEARARAYNATPMKDR